MVIAASDTEDFRKGEGRMVFDELAPPLPTRSPVEGPVFEKPPYQGPVHGGHHYIIQSQGWLLKGV
jgi:hypothetical protein